MTFADAVVECARNDQFVAEFNRLTGSNLSFQDRRAPIEIMIDESTGYPHPFKCDKSELHTFFDFVYEFIWLRL